MEPHNGKISLNAKKLSKVGQMLVVYYIPKQLFFVPKC